jgi:hypothetical protein
MHQPTYELRDYQQQLATSWHDSPIKKYPEELIYVAGFWHFLC